MELTKKEQYAVAYVVEEMLTYGSGSFIEVATAESLLDKIGFDRSSEKCPSMIFQDAINQIKPMPIEKKKSIVAILANIMVADGSIKLEKQKWLNTVTYYCNMPTMNWDEAWKTIDLL